MFESNQWKKRAWGLQLDCMEITRTKAGCYRLWDSSILGGDKTVKIYSTLAGAKKAGCRMLNNAMRAGSAEYDKILWGGVKYAAT